MILNKNWKEIFAWKNTRITDLKGMDLKLSYWFSIYRLSQNEWFLFYTQPHKTSTEKLYI